MVSVHIGNPPAAHPLGLDLRDPPSEKKGIGAPQDDIGRAQPGCVGGRGEDREEPQRDEKRSHLLLGVCDGAVDRQHLRVLPEVAIEDLAFLLVAGLESILGTRLEAEQEKYQRAK